MDATNLMLAIWKNIPPQTIAFLIVVLFLSALLRILPRKRRSNKPQRSEKPSFRAQDKPTSAEEKGQRGEDIIAQILHVTVPGKFQVFRNVYVPYKDMTTELDLVMVHQTGIFVFESKNYSGWIFGSMDGLNWVQRFPNGEKHSFYNPVRQNQNHIKTLSQYLQIPENCFYSYIVFSDKCLLKQVPSDTRSMVITQSLNLEEDLKRMISALPSMHGREEIRRISDRLIPLTNVDSSVKEKHIEDIRAVLESDVCPFCGGKLVTRRGQYGEFLGCSNYPQCKFKRNVMR